MWELDCEESWVPKNWCFWTVVFEKTLESPLDCKGIQPVHLKGNQPWDFFGRNDAKAEAPVLWPPHAKSWLIGKDSDAARDWGQEEKGTTEDEKAGCHHWLDGRDSEWTPGVGDTQGGLVCCNSWGRRVGHWVTELNRKIIFVYRYSKMSDRCSVDFCSPLWKQSVLHLSSNSIFTGMIGLYIYMVFEFSFELVITPFGVPLLLTVKNL